MSYRDEILDYCGECLGGISSTLRSPRVDELSPEDLQELHDELRVLADLALAAKKDKTLKPLD